MIDQYRLHELKRNHTIGRILLGVALAIVIFVLCSPVMTFETRLFTKKSGNTFVGDEKYVAVKAEVEEAAKEYEAKGVGDIRITEEVTERTNSKGEKTSMVAFNVLTGFDKTGIDFMKSSLPSGKVLLALAICVLVGIVFSLPFFEGNVSEKFVPGSVRILRSFGVAAAVIALVLVPAFMMLTTRTYNRTVKLFVQDRIAEEDCKTEFDAAGEFLFGEKETEEYKDLLNGVDFNGKSSYWLMLAGCFALICGTVVLRHDHPEKWMAAAGIYLFVIVLCIVFLYPYYVMFITGFRDYTETTDMYFLHMLPTKWVWSNLRDIINRGIPTYLKNSLFLSFGATLIAMICGIPAAYAMARMKFRGKKFFLGFVIMSQMFSPVVLLVGISSLMKNIHLNDSVVGLMLINAAFNQAFAIWLLRGTFVSISPEMEQAATIDGCSRIESLLYVLLPMAAPGIVTTLIFVFINAWNEYTISTVLISTVTNKPITVGITQFSSYNMIEWQYLFASSLLATIPVVILFLCIEKHLVSGLTSGGVKG